MNNEAAAKRAYTSPLRAQQALTTRRAVLRAATRLFSEQGYVGTSIADIAREAGVSRATVSSSVGPKAVLLKQAYDTTIAGDDDPTPIPARATTRSFRDQPTPSAVLEAYIAHAGPISARIASLAEAVRGAAGADPDARALWDSIRDQRHRAARMVVDAVLAVGDLRDGLDPDTATDLVWILNDGTLYNSMVHLRGWSHEQFQAWRVDAIKAQLLGAS